MVHFFLGIGVIFALFYAANHLLVPAEVNSFESPQSMQAEHAELTANPPKLPSIPGAAHSDQGNWQERHVCLTADCSSYRRERRECGDNPESQCTIAVAICSPGECVDEEVIRHDPAFVTTVQRISQRASEHWTIYDDSAERFGARVEISLTPTGELLGVVFRERSGREAFDFSIQEAIRRAAPFTELAEAPDAVRGLLQRVQLSFGTVASYARSEPTSSEHNPPPAPPLIPGGASHFTPQG